MVSFALMRQTTEEERKMPKQSIQNELGVPDTVRVLTPKEGLEYVITKRDVVKARPGDPSCCAHAVALMRTYGIKTVLVYVKVAYVLWEEEGSKQWIGKYVVSARQNKTTKKFDETKEMDSDLFKLKPMTAGRTPGANKEREEKKQANIRHMVELGMEREEAEETFRRKSKVQHKRRGKTIRKPRHELWRPVATGKYQMGIGTKNGA